MDLIFQLISSTDDNQRNQGFKQLYQSEKILASIQKYIGNRLELDPKEILQEAIIDLDVQIQANKFDGKSSVETYLISICKFKIYNRFRKAGRRIEELKDFSSYAGQEEQNWAHHPEEQEEAKGVREAKEAALREALKQIQEDCQKILIQAHVHKQNMEEIAKAFSLKNAVQARKKVYRCRGRLRAAILNHPKFKAQNG